jgi:hypothetical protein
VSSSLFFILVEGQRAHFRHKKLALSLPIQKIPAQKPVRVEGVARINFFKLKVYCRYKNTRFCDVSRRAKTLRNADKSRKFAFFEE